MTGKIDLDMVSPEKTKNICGEICGGQCCKLAGSNFKVPVSVSDFRKLTQNSKANQIDWSGKYPYLSTKTDGSCIFLNDENLCDIHTFRPGVCERYPFLVDVSHVEDFCILYESASIRLKTKYMKEYDEKSLLDHLFDLKEGPYYDKYMDLLNQG